MKKNLLILMFAAIAVLTSCQTEVLEMNRAGTEVEVSITAEVPKSINTKAGQGQYDNGAVTRYAMEIYHEGELFFSKVQESPIFTVKMVTNQTYDFLFWADNGEEYYDITSKKLTEIDSKKHHTGNHMKRDAFFAYQKEATTANLPKNISLKRPFAQVNIGTLLTNVPENMKPKYVHITYTTELTTKFDVTRNHTYSPETVEWESYAICAESNQSVFDDAKINALSTDYLFASPEGSTVDFKLDFYNAEGNRVATREFFNIAIKANHRTNIHGELMTAEGKINVEIDNAFESDNEVNLHNKVPITDLNTRITDVIHKFMENLPDGNAPANLILDIEIPINDVNATVNITGIDPTKIATIAFNFNEGSTIPKLSIIEDPATSPSPDLFIHINGHCDDLTINTPHSSASLLKGTFSSMSIITKPGTLLVNKDVEIKELIVKGGNATINGLVKKLTIGNPESVAIGNTGRVDLLTIANNEKIVLPFIADAQKIGAIELKSAGSITVSGHPYAGDVTVTSIPSSILIKNGTVIYQDVKYSSDYINGLDARWVGFGYDTGINLSVIGIPQYLGLSYLGVNSNLDFTKLNIKKLSEIKYTYGNATATLPNINLSGLTTTQDIENKLNGKLTEALTKLEGIKSELEQYIHILPADMQKVYRGAIAIAESKLGTQIVINQPSVMSAIPVPTYFEAKSNLSSADIKKLSDSLQSILDLLNNTIEAGEIFKEALATLDEMRSANNKTARNAYIAKLEADLSKLESLGALIGNTTVAGLKALSGTPIQRVWTAAVDVAKVTIGTAADAAGNVDMVFAGILQQMGLDPNLITLDQFLSAANSIIPVLNTAVTIIEPVEHFIDMANPWKYAGSVSANENSANFKVSIKMGDLIEIEKSKTPRLQ